MPVKRCAVCKRPAFPASSVENHNRKWLCPACLKKFESYVSAKNEVPGGQICGKCKKNSKGCRFSVFERQRITACSDWEGKNSEHDKKRWKKYED